MNTTSVTLACVVYISDGLALLLLSHLLYSLVNRIGAANEGLVKTSLQRNLRVAAIVCCLLAKIGDTIDFTQWHLKDMFHASCGYFCDRIGIVQVRVLSILNFVF